MTPLYLCYLHDALATVLAAVLPIISLMLAIGLLTGFFQASFQIEDATFNLMPKTIAMIFIALFGGFGAIPIFLHFAEQSISHAPYMVRETWN
jgi:flagellar biosynthesis protein FliQ